MKVVGVYLVRNEVDLIETNLRHHFGSVIDEAIVIDNGSTDGTLGVLAELARELPIQLASEVGEYYQADRVTRMARLAVAQGADWVLPIDADEFWTGASMPLRHALEEAPAEARALVVEVVTFVQSSDVLVARPGCLSTMTVRCEQPVPPDDSRPQRVWDKEVSWIEISETPKCVHRGLPGLSIPKGNHVTGVEGAVPSDAIVCLHAPMRARSLLATKLDHGRRTLEDGSPAGAAWHVKRWWQLSRVGPLDEEWAALSSRDDAITVGEARHALVHDDRLRDLAQAAVAHVRVPCDRVPWPVEEMEPGVGAYYLALDTVPGWLSPLDFRVLVELDRLQRSLGVEGDLFEIGAYMGRSAILLGHLARRPVERFTVCDVFEHVEGIDPESRLMHNHWYHDLTEKAFIEQYQRFHEQLPDVIVGPSERIDAEERAGTCRMVHVDGGHSYEVVRHDAGVARRLLRPGGIVAFDDVATPHSPGAALAVWELVLSGEFTPLCVTETKLYGTWDAAGIDWVAALDRWVLGTRGLGSEIHTLAGWPTRRIFEVGPPPEGDLDLVRIPDLEGIDEGSSPLGR